MVWFDIVARQAKDIEGWEITWQSEKISSSFHGRDLYAPVCAMLAKEEEIPGSKIEWQEKHQWSDDLNEIIYIYPSDFKLRILISENYH